MESKVLLNGQYVNSKEINPAKHRFIGMYRPPTGSPGFGYVACTCGSTLQTVEAILTHWQLGHADLPQYVDIEKRGPETECSGGEVPQEWIRRKEKR